ncbi:MAG TPA: cation:proton antiporter [Paludibacteraceae bacterium]|jgi:Kef-type K+ transport system membrane component KefB|nr:cation:proton antiporter [Paludibacteraceae bacterium]HPT43865.1 cation:proton antiporter [Paludibacteraceae bacterium]
MTTTLIIIICIIFLIAYFFDLTSSRTRIPAVILLLLLGWGIKQLTVFFHLEIPNLTSILPILGTIGLILIVLEGSLELELNKQKLPVIGKSLLLALLPMFILSLILAFLFMHFGQYSFRNSLINAIPLCIISSAIAIPSVKGLSMSNREFVIYESSLSDIFGIIIFNFIAINGTINTQSFTHFALQILTIIIVSFVATIGLSFLLSRSKHHIKYVPIILFVILIYSISKFYHLPGLVFVLLFGLFIGNIDELKQLKWLKVFDTDNLNSEVQKFKNIVIEGTFLIRTLFFILFGFLIETEEILNTNTLVWSVGIVAGILIVRYIFLKFTKLPITPLLYVAPRGLITILLFLSILPSQSISFVNKSLIIQVIVLTALVMMTGILKKPQKTTILSENEILEL